MVKKGSFQAPTQRQMRVAETIKRSVLEMVTFGKIAPDLNSMTVAISDVQMSSDLRLARIYVEKPFLSKKETIISGKEQYLFVKNIQKYAAYIRQLLARELQMKYAPDVQFFYDDRNEHAHHINSLLNTLTTSES